jgi:hypothetical protein
MHPARDTFLQFLSDNLSPGIAVHNLRRDVNFPDTAQLQMNALNVQFLSDTPSVCISSVSATVDVVYDNELTAIDAATTVYKLLSLSGLIPLLDYTNQAAPPVSLGSNLFWNVDSIKFRSVFGDTYFRYSALMTLSYHLY